MKVHYGLIPRTLYFALCGMDALVYPIKITRTKKKVTCKKCLKILKKDSK